MFGFKKEGLTDEQRSIGSLVANLMQKFGEDYWHKLDVKREYPGEFMKEMVAHGLGALPVPQEFGGPGLGIREASLVLEEVNALGGNAQPFHGQYYLLLMLSRYAQRSLQERYLPAVASGELRVQTLALTEPEAGSESTRIKTSATKGKDGDYLIQGHKTFISRVEHSDLMVIAARTTPYDSVKKKTDGISLFLVDLRKSGGIEKHKINTMFNSQTYELFIKDLRVPQENLIGEEGQGFRYLLGALNPRGSCSPRSASAMRGGFLARAWNTRRREWCSEGR